MLSIIKERIYAVRKSRWNKDILIVYDFWGEDYSYNKICPYAYRIRSFYA